MKKINKSFQWNKITPLSKYLAMALFIAFPFIGFVLGMKYQEKTSISSSNISKIQEIEIPTSISSNEPNTLETYTNHKYSFSINYPSDWLVRENNPQQGDYQEISIVSQYSTSIITFYLPENPDSQDIKTKILKTEVINLGEQPTKFKYFVTTVTGDLDAYSYSDSRKPFNLILFSLGNEVAKQENDLKIIKEILASYKKI